MRRKLSLTFFVLFFAILLSKNVYTPVLVVNTESPYVHQQEK